MTVRPTILVICDYYLPGFESGGAMRTIVNMVERMSDEFDFRIVTRDHDGPLNKKPYETVRIGEWNRVGNTDVYYMPRGKTGSRDLLTLIHYTKPNAIYVNSFFSSLTIAVLSLKKRGRITDVPIILAPEGEFSPGALSLKRVKKQLYLKAAKSLRLLDNITWKTASDSEVSEIEASLGRIDNVHIAPNLPPLTEDRDPAAKPPKSSGTARMAFLSRYMRKKNFNWLLERLNYVEGDLKISIYGPIEDAEYWKGAEELIAKLPENVRVTARGPVSYDKVNETLSKYEFFVLPTLGENFGHVFVEAFAAGCPVITSDRTPWRDLEEKGIGWDLSLETPQRWVEIIDRCIAMKADEFSAMSKKASEFAKAWLAAPELEGSNREVLRAAIEKGRV